MFLAPKYFFNDNFNANIFQNRHEFIVRNIFKNSLPTAMGFLFFKTLGMPYTLNRSGKFKHFGSKIYQFEPGILIFTQSGNLIRFKL